MSSKFSRSATLDLVRAYLIDAYGLTHAQASDAIIRHQPAVNKGIAWHSFADYVGDEIAKAEGLTMREGFDMDDEDEDDG